MADVISSRRLREAGLSTHAIARRVRDGSLIRLRRGMYARPGVADEVADAVRVGGKLTCVSALAFHGVWTMPHPDLHVLVSSGVAVAPRVGHRLHWTHARLDLEHAVDSPTHAVAVAVECLDLRAAVVAIDSALNRWLITRTELERILFATPRGRLLLPKIDGTAESGIETLARLALRRRRLRVRTQVPIARVGRVDILIGDRLVLEVDGREWHADFESDRARDRTLVALGYLVIRASYRQVMHDWPLIEAQITELTRRREHLWRTTLPQGARRRPR
jgi:very-short-patch-repair endonuclease